MAITILEKALKDGMKEDQCTVGAKQVLNGMKNSKLIVISKSLTDTALQKIMDTAGAEKVPTVKFDGTSVALGKLCGLQFRISTLSFNSLSEANVTSIIKESEPE